MYKIGITGKSIKERMRSEPPYEVICSTDYIDGVLAYNIEQCILNKYCKHVYKGSIKHLKSGNTELLCSNVVPTVVFSLANTLKNDATIEDIEAFLKEKVHKEEES
jgi:hypothetical protein